MKNWLRQHFQKNRYYYFSILIFYAFAFYRIGLYSKIDNHLFFNRMVGNVYVDTFFKYLTHMGDGWFLIFVVLLWLFKNIRESLYLLLSYAVAGGLAAVLKNYVFDVARPHFVFDYFHKEIVVKYVDGVDLMALNSFPSGHSTTAFVLSSFLAFHCKNDITKLLLSLLGIMVIFSRVYLSQHWLNDIVAGSLLGLITTIISDYLFTNYQFLQKLNKSILNN